MANLAHFHETTKYSARVLPKNSLPGIFQVGRCRTNYYNEKIKSKIDAKQDKLWEKGTGGNNQMIIEDALALTSKKSWC